MWSFENGVISKTWKKEQYLQRSYDFPPPSPQIHIELAKSEDNILSLGDNVVTVLFTTKLIGQLGRWLIIITIIIIMCRIYFKRSLNKFLCKYEEGNELVLWKQMEWVSQGGEVQRFLMNWCFPGEQERKGSFYRRNNICKGVGILKIWQIWVMVRIEMWRDFCALKLW